MTFGNALLSYRLGEAETQAEFARFLDISVQSLCDIEAEKEIPSPSQAAKIAQKLGEPIAFWVQLAFQDMLKMEKLDLVVSVSHLHSPVKMPICNVHIHT